MVKTQSVHFSNLTKVGTTYTRNLRLRLENQLRPCWQWCANGCDNSQQCWDLQCIVGGYNRFHTLCNNPQQHATTCNKVCKRTQHATSKNAGSCWQQCCLRLHGALVNYKRECVNSCCLKVAIKRVVYSWQHPGLC